MSKTTKTQKPLTEAGEAVPNWREFVQGRALCDDALLRIALYKRPEVAKVILEPILGRKDFEIVNLEVQKHSGSVAGHSAVFDAIIEFADGTVCDVEMQKSMYDAPAKRIRFYSSMLDVSSLGKGCNYEKLPKCITIFIVKGDYGETGEPIYHVERRYRENGRPFEDGSEIILVDLNRDEEPTELGRLIHDLKAIEPDDIRNPVLYDIADRLKYDRGDKTMDEAGIRFLEEVMPEYGQKWKEKGIEEGKKESILGLYRKGAIDAETAAESLNMTVEEFLALAKKKDD